MYSKSVLTKYWTIKHRIPVAWELPPSSWFATLSFQHNALASGRSQQAARNVYFVEISNGISGWGGCIMHISLDFCQIYGVTNPHKNRRAHRDPYFIGCFETQWKLQSSEVMSSLCASICKSIVRLLWPLTTWKLKGCSYNSFGAANTACSRIATRTEQQQFPIVLQACRRCI